MTIWCTNGSNDTRGPPAIQAHIAKSFHMEVSCGRPSFLLLTFSSGRSVGVITFLSPKTENNDDPAFSRSSLQLMIRLFPYFLTLVFRPKIPVRCSLEAASSHTECKGITVRVHWILVALPRPVRRANPRNNKLPPPKEYGALSSPSADLFLPQHPPH